MARLDVSSGRLVLRIVYDGPGFAGKTTTVKSLGQTYQRPVFSSETEEGRTLHFDWMNFEGGRFENFSLCCQVVSVPGQVAFSNRRLFLLESADAVVFVLDSRRSKLEHGIAALESLRTALANRPAPRPGIVVQANWRDAPDAVALDEIRDLLQIGDAIAVTESIATGGSGILQTFVLAIRLALDRAAVLLGSGDLDEGSPDVSTGQELLAAMARLESESPLLTRTLPAIMPADAEAEPEPVAETPGLPQLPNDRLPSGRVWPPIEGRLMLHEAGAERATLQNRPSGDWVAQNGRWYFHSAVSSFFDNDKEARDALIEWARWHTAVANSLSPRRCLSLVEQNATHWRLWQTVRAEPSLSRSIESALRDEPAATIVNVILDSARMLEECRKNLAEARLPVTFETVGLVDARPVYVGAVPSIEYLDQLRAREVVTSLDFERLFEPLLERTGFATSPKRPAVLDGVLEAARIPALEEFALTLAALLNR